jgi:very-short-patch-repair endonuclease
MVSKPPKKLRDQLERWRADLINLTKRNKLLYFKHTKSSSLEITNPAIGTIFNRLDGPDNARFWEFRSVDASIDDATDLKRNDLITTSIRDLGQTEVLTNKLFSDELFPVLRNLDRRSKEQFVDTGLWTLYIAFGFLQWEDPNDKSMTESPLLLVPVELVKNGPQSKFRLQRTQDDPAINPALAEKMDQDYGIKLPGIDGFEDLTPAAVIAHISKLITRQKNWAVNEKTVLALFSFQKESIYQDLGQNSEAVLNHPMIQLLGLGPDSDVEEFAFDKLNDFEVDATLPPEQMLTIRDADSTQRKCIIAAREGKSFVMDGPPGTGKSQTISNIIAELIGTGKTVLFVSEKAAALDVVYKRLRESGLHEFVLNLHSHDTSRKAVATELGRALLTRPRATATRPVDTSKLLNTRKKLTDYSIALNEIRDDLGQSLHDVIGRVGQLNEFPSLDTSNIDDFGALNTDRLNRVIHEVELLATVWEPISSPETFYWKNLIDTSATQSRMISSKRKLLGAIEKLNAVETIAAALAEDLELGDISTFEDLDRYLEILQLLDIRPNIPPTGLTNEVLFDETYLQSMQQLFDERNRLELRITADLTVSWSQLDSKTILVNDQLFDPIRATAPLIINDESCTAVDFESAAQIMKQLRSEISRTNELALRLFSVLEISNELPNLNDAQSLSEVLEIISEQVGISDTWLNQPSIEKIRNSFQIVKSATKDVNDLFESLRPIFKETVVDIDASNLFRRFTELHKGFRKLSKQSRIDKKSLKIQSPINKFNKNSISALPKVVELQNAIKHMAETTLDSEPWLATHLNGRNTNFDRLDHAIEVTSHLLSNERRVCLSGKVRLLLVNQTGIPADALIDALALKESLSKVAELLANIQESDSGVLRSRPINDVATHLDEQIESTEALHATITSSNALNGQNFKWSDLVGLAHIHQKIAEFDVLISTHDPRLLDIFGDNYQGLSTDWESIFLIGSWILEFKEVVTVGSIKHSALILETEWSGEFVRQAIESWKIEESGVIEEFELEYRSVVAHSLQGRILDARESLEARIETTSQIVIWSDFQRCIGNLQDLGLSNFVDSLLGIRDPDVLAKAAEKSLLEYWTDNQIQTDRRINPMHGTDRDNLVNLFSQLDKDLIDSAASQIINICSQRRPNSNIGAAAIIQRQSQLSRKHKPTKELLSETSTVTKLLKPCFMMSPLSVSRYLPSDMKFDAVIFDEASQVKPADAINSIYRGNQLIVAGDQKQLPPTSFFDSALNTDGTDDDDYDEFESILDLCKGTGGLESLPLLWHYRSQHEDLITFSNYRFYDGLLKTFPSAQQNAADLGVELFHVSNGVYRRGGQRDNPIEAEAVVDRVIFHKQKHPNLSMGVVAFSVAQQDAIMAALENRSRSVPELRDIISGDRLDGFFVKNLENVQGDDRDIIIFSIGYGPDEAGKITMNFGPMNGPSGNRRLNVAITRAKRRVEIVTSIRPAQFGSGITGGVKNLRDYLHFAEVGISALVQGSMESEGDLENPFEADIANTIRRLGYDIVPQVGAAGYRIDIGVIDPDNSSRFILGVEADGATYHRTFVARDRDRLRQNVLEGLGWRFHRVWSTAWFRDRTNEELRLKEALESARVGSRKSTTKAIPRQTIDITIDEVSADENPTWVSEYKTANLRSVSTRFEFNDPRATSEIVMAIKSVVDTEGPVHEDRILRIVREHYGIGRAGVQIRDSFERALRTVLRNDYTKKDGFVSTSGQNLQTVRSPNRKIANSTRSIDEIPPGEIDLAVMNLIHDAMNATTDELTVRISRLFGWARTGTEISASVERSINRLSRKGLLDKAGSNVSLKQD